MSGAGITRYFDDYKSKFEIQPTHIIVLAVAVIGFILALHYFGGPLS
jgi:preprotein translocase subunit Sec61beta